MSGEPSVAPPPALRNPALTVSFPSGSGSLMMGMLKVLAAVSPPSRLPWKRRRKKDEQTSRRHKRHDRGEDVMGFIYHPLSNTAQGTSNVR